MPKFKIHTPVRSEHVEMATAIRRIRHSIISNGDVVLFEQYSFGAADSDHTDVTSLYDQVAAAINAKYVKG